jgi:hypothetical protein
MVFQLPVVDFPEHGDLLRLSAHDLIKTGYLHSETLRWSAGAIRGRDGEWQFPASKLTTPELVRGVTAMGFSALTLDRRGYADDGRRQVRELTGVLGPPIARGGHDLLAWDLRPARATLLAGTSAVDRRAIARRLLDAPHLYLASDVDPIVDRGDPHPICAHGSLSLVNPAKTPTVQELVIVYARKRSDARFGHVTIGSRRVLIRTDRRSDVVPVTLAPGTTHATIDVKTPGARCGSVPVSALPSVSASLRAPGAPEPIPAGPTERSDQPASINRGA